MDSEVHCPWGCPSDLHCLVPWSTPHSHAASVAHLSKGIMNATAENPTQWHWRKASFLPQTACITCPCRVDIGCVGLLQRCNSTSYSACTMGCGASSASSASAPTEPPQAPQSNPSPSAKVPPPASVVEPVTSVCFFALWSCSKCWAHTPTVFAECLP